MRKRTSKAWADIGHEDEEEIVTEEEIYAQKHLRPMVRSHIPFVRKHKTSSAHARRVSIWKDHEDYILGLNSDFEKHLAALKR